MHKADEDPQQPSGLPYATDEITFPVLGKAAILLLIFAIFSTVLASGAYWLFVVQETVRPAHVLEATPIQPDPNVPILQRDPVAEIHKFRADEYDAERSYSHWQDGDGKSSLRIPIDRAMEIVKANGLPRAAKPAVVAPMPNVGAGANSSAPVNPPVAPTSPSPPGVINAPSTGPAPVEAPDTSGAATTGAAAAGASPNTSGTANPAAGSRP